MPVLRFIPQALRTGIAAPPPTTTSRSKASDPTCTRASRGRPLREWGSPAAAHRVSEGAPPVRRRLGYEAGGRAAPRSRCGEAVAPKPLPRSRCVEAVHVSAGLQETRRCRARRARSRRGPASRFADSPIAAPQPAHHVVRRVRQHARDESRACAIPSSGGPTGALAPTMPGIAWHVAHAYWSIARLPRRRHRGAAGSAGSTAAFQRRLRRAVLVGRQLRQLADERDDRPEVVVGQPELPRRHARHLDAVLDDPEDLGARPLARRVREVRRRRHQPERERLRRNAGRAMALHAVLAEKRAPAPDLCRLVERRHGDRARAA